jgi:hypothetical protein
MKPFDSAIAILEQIIAIKKANQEKMEANTETSHKPREAESKTDFEEMDAIDLEESPEELQYEVEHEVPKEGATLEEQYWGRHLAVRRCGLPRKQTHANGGSWKKLAAARRGMTQWAGVAWCKGCGHKGQTAEQKWGEKADQGQCCTLGEGCQAKLECKTA